MKIAKKYATDTRRLGGSGGSEKRRLVLIVDKKAPVKFRLYIWWPHDRRGQYDRPESLSPLKVIGIDTDSIVGP